MLSGLTRHPLGWQVDSTTWKWAMFGPPSQWRYSHNYRHHVFTNVVGMDDRDTYG